MCLSCLISDCHLLASTVAYEANCFSLSLRFKYSLGVSGFVIAFSIMFNALCTDLISASDTNFELVKSSSHDIGSLTMSFAVSTADISGSACTKLYCVGLFLISL